MSFVKHATWESLGAVRVASDGGVAVTASPRERTASEYLNKGVRAVDLQAAIDAVAGKYDLSRDASHYTLEAIRAVTSGSRNRNFDNFPRDEMLRGHLKRGGMAYETFRLAPHHRNHEADVDSEALGFIVDCSYNDHTPALDECPQCGKHTADESARDDGGLRCGDCGHVVKAEFVECLVATDNSKDPTFGMGVIAGDLPASSMGCICDETGCHVCGNIAKSADEFCNHIASAKGQWHVRDAADALPRRAWSLPNFRSAADPWRRIPTRLARQAYLLAYRLGGWDNCDNFVVGGKEYRLAVEACRRVTFRELSRVARPADPDALSIQIIAAQRAAKSEALIALAKANRENKDMSKFHIVAVDGDHNDTYAGPTLEAAVRAAYAADAPKNAKLTYVETEAPDANTACKLWVTHAKSAAAVPPAILARLANLSVGDRVRGDDASVADSDVEDGVVTEIKDGQALIGWESGVSTWVDFGDVTRIDSHDADVTMRVPDGATVQMLDSSGNPLDSQTDPNAMPDPNADPMAPGAPAAPAAPGAPGSAPANQSDQLTPEELGLSAPPARAADWHQAHERMHIAVGKNQTVITADDTARTLLMTLPNATPITTRADRVAREDAVLAALDAGGLLGLRRKFNGSWARTAGDAMSIGDVSGAPDEIGSDGDARANPIAPDPDSIAVSPQDATPDHARDNEAMNSVIASAVEAALAEAKTTHEAEVRQLGSRYEAATQAGVRKARREAQDEAIASLARALKVIFRRQSANLEESHLKNAVLMQLSQEQEIPTTLGPRTSEAMPTSLAEHFIEAAWSFGASAEADFLAARAGDLMRSGEAFLKSAEADAKALTPALPVVAIDVSDVAAERMRDRIREGSFTGQDRTDAQPASEATYFPRRPVVMNGRARTLRN